MRCLHFVGRLWLKFAVVLGNVQMVILLSIIFWIMVGLVALPFKLLADPLSLRRGRHVGWTERRPIDYHGESMRRQG